MDLPLDGIKIIDFTGVQAGARIHAIAAWFGADVLRVERPGVDDVTRNQLRAVPNLDALCLTMLNSNKKSLELNTKTPEGKMILERLIRDADVLVENLAPGAPGSTSRSSIRESSSVRSRGSARDRPMRI